MRRLHVALVAGALLLALCAAFDWNWFRAPLAHWLSERSGRPVRIGALQVSLGLHPTLLVRDLYVPNADWAGERPLIDAREAVFTLALHTVFDERRVLPMVVLRDAEVNMEELSDGRRNWRLVNPENRGPGRFTVQHLDATNSTVAIRNHVIDLDLRTAASPSGSTDPKFSSRIEFQGRYAGQAFSGQAFAAMPLPMRDSHDAVPVRGHLQWERAAFDLDGRVADLWRPSLIDAELNGKVGTSPVSGELHYERADPRPRLRAALRTERAKLADFIGAAEKSQGSSRLFSARPFDAGLLRRADVDLRVDTAQLQTAGPTLTDLHFQAAVRNGVLDVKPLSFGIAGGDVTVSVNADDAGADGALRMQARAAFSQLRLERMPGIGAHASIAGPLDGELELHGRGNSLAALMADASGRLEARMDRGRLSRMADAKMALDGGRILAAVFGSARDVAILGGRGDIEFERGVGRVDRLTLETEKTRLEGRGRVDLRAEKLDLLLTPHPKHPTLLAMHGQFSVSGPIRKPEVALKSESPAR